MSLLAKAFDNPVMDAQSVFRTLMNALAFPGRIMPLSVSAEPPLPLTPEAAALLLSLCDAETRLYLSPAFATDAVCAYLRFHTGVVLVEDKQAAQFALIDLEREQLVLSDYAQGEANYPDRSTTIFGCVAALNGGEPLTLRGPGIEKVQSLTLALPADFIAQWVSNRSQYPLGVDVVFVGPQALIGLPRTTIIVKEA